MLNSRILLSPETGPSCWKSPNLRVCGISPFFNTDVLRPVDCYNVDCICVAIYSSLAKKYINQPSPHMGHACWVRRKLLSINP